MKEPTIIRIKTWGFEAEKLDDSYFTLIIYGNTKDGNGNRHEIHCKMRYAYIGHLFATVTRQFNKQLEKFKSYLTE